MPDEPVIGRLTIEALDNGTSMPHLRLSFDPVGRLTPMTIEHHLSYIYNEINRAQVAARNGVTPSRREDVDDVVEDSAPLHTKRTRR